MPIATLRDPDGPRGRALVGNGYDYERDRLGFLRQSQKQFGDVFRFSPSTVVVLDPELIHEMFARTNEAFMARQSLLRHQTRLYRDDELAAMMESRRRARRGLGPGPVGQTSAVLASGLDRMLAPTLGGEIDVLDHMRVYCGRAGVEFCFGIESEDLVAAAMNAQQAIRRLFSSPLKFPRWLPIPRVKNFQRSAEILDRLIGERVAAASNEDPCAGRSDMLAVLTAKGEAPISDDAIVQILAAALRATHDPPGVAMTWAVRTLYDEPRILENVRREAAQLDLREARVADLPYAEAFAKELLRAYTPAWLTSRTVSASTSLGGWRLEAGEEVMFSPYLVHNDDRWWDEPQVFRPERWIPHLDRRGKRAYFPFGGGARGCIGMHLGMAQLVLGIANLAAGYEIEVTNRSQAVQDTTDLLTPRGLRAIFRRR